MSTAKSKYEALAAKWQACGRPANQLSDGWSLIALRCWSSSNGGKQDGISQTLAEHLLESEKAQPEGWIDAYLEDREFCSDCGESYRAENLAVCTHCHEFHCYVCKASSSQASNSNPQCRCGGELVG